MKLSLKWRAILPTSLLLIGLATIFTGVSYHNLFQQFRETQNDNYDRQRREIRMSLIQASSNLKELASVVAASGQLGEMLADRQKARPGEQLKVALIEQWSVGLNPALKEALREGLNEDLREEDRGEPVSARTPGEGMTERETGAADRVRESRIARALLPQWPALQLEAGIDKLVVADATGIPVALHGLPMPSLLDQRLLRWMQQSVRREAPTAALFCAENCRQYVAVPVLYEGKSVGVVALSRSLADVIVHTRQSTGYDVALLTAGSSFDNAFGGEPEAVSGDNIAPWGLRVAALTDAGQNRPLIQAAAAGFSLSEMTRGPVRFAHQDRHIEAMTLSIDQGMAPSGAGYLLLLSDITPRVATIFRKTRNILLLGLGGWLAAELLLLLILWQPMVRLRRLSATLPALAEGGFDRVRRELGHPRASWRDEIDVLDATALGLADRLECLERDVRARDRQLSLRLEELSRERDFIRGLMNTAQVMVLAQDKTGRITLSNRYAQSVLGLSEQALMGRRFASLGGEPVRLSNASGEAGDAPAEQQESRIVDARGRQRIITWGHAPLDTQGGDAASVISAGIDVTARKQAEERLSWLAHRDPLTALYNRRYFEKALQSIIDARTRCAVLYLDLDRFREVNELGGHHAGDRLLRLVARTLSRELGGTGVIARQGGDEFSILLEHADAEAAIDVARRVHQKLDNIVFSEGGRRHRALASIGIALYPEHGASQVELMASADFAMYRAKENGLEKWHLLSGVQKTRQQLQERVYWVERIREALEKNLFELVVQPIARVTDRCIQHYEVLVRMKDADGALIMPGHFIGVAERSGQIVELDRWVISASIALLKRMPCSTTSLAINVSAPSLHDSELSPFLERKLEESGVSPERLIVEVTETAAVTDFTAAGGVLQRIRALGCRVALDDFGVGFSSFHYLVHMPADYIKIDGSFIRDLPNAPEDRLIVKAIADIARGMNKKVIAEFVGSAETLSLLSEYGIDYAQGYFIGVPADFDRTFYP